MLRLGTAAGALLLSITADAAGPLSIVGTGDALDVVRALGEHFTRAHPDMIVNVPSSIGSGGGIAAVGAGKEAMGRIARPLTAAERERGIEGVPLLRVPAAFYVHASTGVRNLTAGQVADIYEGKIQNWKDVGGSDQRIRVVRREEADSTLQVLRASMPGWDKLAIIERSMTATSTQDAIHAVEENPGAIGFGPYTLTLEEKLPILRINGLYPTDGGYPSAVTVSLIWKAETITAEAREFLRYAQCLEAARTIKVYGAIPAMELRALLKQ